MTRPFAALAAVFLMLSFAGCGQPASPMSLTSPVKGTITYKGKPLTKGLVNFHPDGAGREAYGEIGPDGAFVLTTYQKGDGAVIGTHRVAVSRAGKALPTKYASPEASKVEVEVARDKVEYAIDLK